MKVFEIELTVTAVVAAESEFAAERWADLNMSEICRGSTVLTTSSREITTRAELDTVENGQWNDAQPYGLPSGDKRLIVDLLPFDPTAPYRCEQTVDMFSPNPVTAGIDRDTTGAIGQP
jgi:hypothetical protein